MATRVDTRQVLHVPKDISVSLHSTLSWTSSSSSSSYSSLSFSSNSLQYTPPPFPAPLLILLLWLLLLLLILLFLTTSSSSSSPPPIPPPLVGFLSHGGFVGAGEGREGGRGSLGSKNKQVQPPCTTRGDDIHGYKRKELLRPFYCFFNEC